jgi:hypothetical protein
MNNQEINDLLIFKTRFFGLEHINQFYFFNNQELDCIFSPNPSINSIPNS